ncbi:hypothetical protein GGS26DRAFT_64900 [Hypomontagnella submonticulosa]|nr:hypothetical protein GGS26DRAFT_64900 [Hypomontagnella submonticulosa]
MMPAQIPAAHKVRKACDVCHKAKARCSRGSPCKSCARSGRICRYSISNRLGRPPRGVPITTRDSSNRHNKKREIHHQPLLEEDLTLPDGFLPDALLDSSHTLPGLWTSFGKLEDLPCIFGDLSSAEVSL